MVSLHLYQCKYFWLEVTESNKLCCCFILPSTNKIITFMLILSVHGNWHIVIFNNKKKNASMCVLCGVCYVVCVMWCVLCGVCYVVCVMWCVLCEVCYVKCVMWSVLCEVCYVKCVMWSVLCEVCYVKCVMWSVLCEVCYVKCVMWSVCVPVCTHAWVRVVSSL